ncbi:CAP family protein [Streptomyces sp. NPDC088725]|uniref:CAP family protein n=1 Tax=Streptomyces sp. NPDC088725 TaxID=3365873 RepID=UPI0037FD2022
MKLKKIGVLLAVATLVGVTGVPAQAREPLRDSTDRAFLREILRSVNSYRARHGVPPVKLDTKVTRYAKSRAATVSSREQLREAHRGLDHKYGENLFWHGSTEPNKVAASAAVRAWYEESSKYDFDSGQFSEETGHFTQLVWKGTKRIGAARADGKGDDEMHESYIVVNFSPPGNMTGAFKENVLPAT